MSLTGRTPTHPATFSPPVLEAIRPILVGYELPVHDPFAGEGRKLGALCDELGLPFTGTDIEAWPQADPRVAGGDSRFPLTYPAPPFAVVTSPVYFGNRISSDYVNGPTPNTKLAGRHAYGTSLGRPLHRENLARFCRRGHGDEHDARARAVVRHWHELAVVNVDAPIGDRWTEILLAAGYELVDRLEVVTRRLRGGIAGADKRADFEVVLVAVRP